MLAIKLHKKKKPFIGNKSYLIPILSWETGKIYIKNWIKMLNRHNQNKPNNKINYITLVRIPKDHPVGLFDDWCHGLNGIDEWPKLSDIPDVAKQEILKWHEPHSVAKLFDPDSGEIEGEMVWGGDMSEFFPELLIVQGLPDSSVLWTKDLNLLYYGNKKRKAEQITPADD